MFDFQCSVIAGGLSSRMGNDKLLLPFGDGSLLDFTIGKFSVLTHLNVISNKSYILPTGIRQHCDILKSVGPISGLHSALVNSATDLCLVVAADMPFVDLSLVKHLIPHAYEYDIVIFMENTRRQYLFGLYSKKLYKSIELLIAQARGTGKVNASMKHLYEQSRSFSVEAAKLPEYTEFTFFNINTPEEYQKALSIRTKLY